jgi:hypothetical protein
MISVIGVNLLLPIWAVVFSRRILPLFAFTEKRVHYRHPVPVLSYSTISTERREEIGRAHV